MMRLLGGGRGGRVCRDKGGGLKEKVRLRTFRPIEKKSKRKTILSQNLWGKKKEKCHWIAMEKNKTGENFGSCRGRQAPLFQTFKRKNVKGGREN